MNPQHFATMLAAIMIVIHRQNAVIKHAEALEEGLAACFRSVEQTAQHVLKMSEVIHTLNESNDVTVDRFGIHLEAIKQIVRRLDGLEEDVSALYRARPTD